MRPSCLVFCKRTCEHDLVVCRGRVKGSPACHIELHVKFEIANIARTIRNPKFNRKSRQNFDESLI